MTTASQNITDLPDTRSKALALGATKYFTGKPCLYGHTTYRYTRSAACKDCSAPKLAAYLKKTKETQPDRFKNWRTKANANWNASTKGMSAKQRWKEKDPKWAWAVSTLGSCRSRCQAKGIIYEMTNVWLYNNAPDTCPVLGISLIYPTGKTRSTVNRNSATMDRMIPEKGYTPENVVVMSLAANSIKSSANSKQVQKVADWMKSCGL